MKFLLLDIFKTEELLMKMFFATVLNYMWNSKLSEEANLVTKFFFASLNAWAVIGNFKEEVCQTG